jgi:hypothetical protein
MTRLNLGGDGGEPCFISIDKRQMTTLLGERDADGAPDAARRAGHDRDSILKFAHLGYLGIDPGQSSNIKSVQRSFR